LRASGRRRENDDAEEQRGKKRSTHHDLRGIEVEDANYELNAASWFRGPAHDKPAAPLDTTGLEAIL